MGWYDELGNYYSDQGEDNSGGGTGSSDWSSNDNGGSNFSSGFDLGSFFNDAVQTATSYASQLPAPTTTSYQDYNAPNYSGGFGSSDWESGSGSNWYQNLNLPNLFENSTPAPDQGFNWPSFGQQNNYGFPSSNPWQQPGEIQKKQADDLFQAPGQLTDYAANSDTFLATPAQTTRNLWQSSVDPLLGFTPSIVGDISQGQFPGVLSGVARSLFDGVNYGEEMRAKKQQATGEMYDAIYKQTGNNDQANQAAQKLDAYLNPANLAEYSGLEDFHKLPGWVQAGVSMGDPVLMGGLAYLSKLKGVRPVPGEAPQTLHSEAPTLPEQAAGTQIAPPTGQSAAQMLPSLDYYADRPGFVQNLQKAIFDNGGRPTAVSDLEKNRISLIKGGLSQDEYMQRLAQAATQDGLSLDDLWKASGKVPPAPAGTVAPSTPPLVNIEPPRPYLDPTTHYSSLENINAESVPLQESVSLRPQPQRPAEPLPFRRPTEPRPGREVEPPRPVAAELPEEVSSGNSKIEPAIEEETPDYNRPFWQSPYFYLPAGAAAFGGGYGIGALQDALRQPPPSPQNTPGLPPTYQHNTSTASLPPPPIASTTPSKPAQIMSNSAFEKKYQQYQSAGGEHADHMETAKNEYLAEGAPVPQALTGQNYQKTIQSRDNFLKANPKFAKALTQRRTTQPLEPLDYQGWENLFKQPVTYFAPSESIESVRDRLRKPGKSGFTFPLPTPVNRPVVAPGPALPRPGISASAQLPPWRIAVEEARKKVLL